MESILCSYPEFQETLLPENPLRVRGLMQRAGGRPGAAVHSLLSGLSVWTSRQRVVLVKDEACPPASAL